ncbi:MAG: heparinase II/III family protein [Pseudomonadota bacterium]
MGAAPKSGHGETRAFSVLDHVQTRLTGLSHKATGFVSQPEPRTIGSHARGRQMVAGNFRLGGHLVQAPDTSIWDIAAPDPLFEADRQGFTWLDDLAKITDGSTRRLAQAWLNSWIDRYGKGKGLGWAPQLVGRRVIRWINHAVFLLNAQSVDNSRAYFTSLSHQTNFLALRASGAPVGLPRFEALTGLLYASVSLEGMVGYLAPATRALARECDAQIDEQGGLPTRNPEQLMDVLINLNWAISALREHEQEVPGELVQAVRRALPTLIALRHADGGLARFHGGGRGAEGQLDYAISSSLRHLPPAEMDMLIERNVTNERPGAAMGYTAINQGRTSLITDTAAPPKERASADAHASTLAFELTSGRHQVVVNCGSGNSFGADWRRAGRATPSHSTLSVLGISSAKLSSIHSGEYLIQSAQDVRIAALPESPDAGLIAAHDGYVRDLGLTHIRKLELAGMGRELRGEDTFCAISEPDRRIFETKMNQTALEGVTYALRFHLHPDIESSLDMGGTAVSMALKGGEIWVFRFSGAARLSLDPSVYLESGRIKPRASKQIVLTARLMEYAGHINWTLIRAREASRR